MDVVITLHAFQQYITREECLVLRLVCAHWQYTCAILQQEMLFSKKTKCHFNLNGTRFTLVWQQFHRLHAEKIKTRLLKKLPAIEKKSIDELKKKLCESTNNGQMPSFANSAARSGYIASKINRAINIPNLFFSKSLQNIRAELFAKRQTPRIVRLASIGGGPGFDVIGIDIFINYLRTNTQLLSVVYDYEEGWRGAVNALNDIMSQSNTNSTKQPVAVFNICDITQNLTAKVNDHLQKHVKDYDIFAFSFVCVENYQLLKGSNYTFLDALFAEASYGSLFIFSDSTHRLWPDIYKISQCQTHALHVLVPFARSCHYALILQKALHTQDSKSLNEAISKLKIFEEHARHHERRQAKSKIVLEVEYM